MDFGAVFLGATFGDAGFDPVAHFVFACQATFNSHLPFVLALFLAGLSGSLAHCLTMCSGFVMAQVSANKTPSLWTQLLLPYHLGRSLTYGLLGAIAASGVAVLSKSAMAGLLAKILLGFVAVVFVSMALERLLNLMGVRVRFPAFLPKTTACVMGLVARLQALSGIWARFGLGLSLGFLPCGLLYTALMAAAATGNPLSGFVGMVAFGLGTMPALWLLSLGANAWFKGIQHWQDKLAVGAFGLNGLILLLLAARV